MGHTAPLARGGAASRQKKSARWEFHLGAVRSCGNGNQSQAKLGHHHAALTVLNTVMARA
ncbi:hypothetical protein DGo_CA1445 [Deinococcus gobiensis I-0]|uniref:Uncharacterized protein n=1 Tax=Deinococcus gobiensis (strain DSM 21396 / JCM 16679 / CGMCC 1.7299 / I-0) TaxID=745776 RepID=H8GTP4_DEIGI|nr:hypothetical protein DGo_CA1445 [Deinococcus gobiensis I-0]